MRGVSAVLWRLVSPPRVLYFTAGYVLVALRMAGTLQYVSLDEGSPRSWSTLEDLGKLHVGLGPQQALLGTSCLPPLLQRSSDASASASARKPPQRRAPSRRYFPRRGLHGILAETHRAPTRPSLCKSLPASVAPWNGYRAAYSTSWDDGNDAQVTFVSSLLHAFGIEATFYISAVFMMHPTDKPTPDQLVRKWDFLRANMLGKHEIGAHTVRHPNLERTHNLTAAIIDDEFARTARAFSEELPPGYNSEAVLGIGGSRGPVPGDFVPGARVGSRFEGVARTGWEVQSWERALALVNTSGWPSTIEYAGMWNRYQSRAARTLSQVKSDSVPSFAWPGGGNTDLSKSVARSWYRSARGISCGMVPWWPHLSQVLDGHSSEKEARTRRDVSMPVDWMNLPGCEYMKGPGLWDMSRVHDDQLRGTFRDRLWLIGFGHGAKSCMTVDPSIEGDRGGPAMKQSPERALRNRLRRLLDTKIDYLLKDDVDSRRKLHELLTQHLKVPALWSDVGIPVNASKYKNAGVAKVAGGELVTAIKNRNTAEVLECRHGWGAVGALELVRHVRHLFSVYKHQDPIGGGAYAVGDGNFTQNLWVASVGRITAYLQAAQFVRLFAELLKPRGSASHNVHKHTVGVALQFRIHQLEDVRRSAGAASLDLEKNQSTERGEKNQGDHRKGNDVQKEQRKQEQIRQKETQQDKHKQTPEVDIDAALFGRNFPHRFANRQHIAQVPLAAHVWLEGFRISCKARRKADRRDPAVPPASPIVNTPASWCPCECVVRPRSLSPRRARDADHSIPTTPGTAHSSYAWCERQHSGTLLLIRGLRPDPKMVYIANCRTE
ncbi:unnamed protein product [Amoebophrya sp. A25]|nr:unnamed protein product [Amoebophrya sp. A25]|eukprot:GSA25T00025787001.1